MKSKGYRSERELVHMLWERGFAAVRSPASGSMSYPAPDIIAGNGRRYIAIEVKMRANLPVYVSREDVENLVKFSEIFGAEPFIAIKIAKEGWRFLYVENLKRTRNGYKIDDEVFYSGLEFDELIGNLRQKRLFE